MATRLRCPEDQKLLAVHRHDEIELQVCRHCHGVWLTREQLASRCVRSENLPAEARRKADSKRRETGRPRTCSQCLVPLNPQLVEGVEIDLCPKCGGLWLDAGEFDAVHHWYMMRYAKAASTKRSLRADAADGLAHSPDALVETATSGLREIVEFLCECGGSLLEGL